MAVAAVGVQVGKGVTSRSGRSTSKSRSGRQQQHDDDDDCIHELCCCSDLSDQGAQPSHQGRRCRVDDSARDEADDPRRPRILGRRDQ